MNIKEFKSAAIDTCVEAITSTSKNLVEVVATRLQTLHAKAVAEGMNEPLKFSKAEAERIAFDARCNFNKVKGVAYPKKIKYDHSKSGGFASFRARELELTKIVQNIEHYDVAKTACDELVEDGIYTQTGASELVRAMHAIGGGTSPEKFQIEAKASKDTRATTKDEADAKAITPEGFTERLEALIEDATQRGIVLGDDGKTFETVEVPNINDMPDPKPEVMDAAAIAKMMEMPEFGQAMAAFMTKLTTK